MAETIFDIQDVGLTVSHQTLLSHISFTVAPGEFVTITGPSGSGKSTLLLLLATLLTPTEGQIILPANHNRTMKNGLPPVGLILLSATQSIWQHGRRQPGFSVPNSSKKKVNHDRMVAALAEVNLPADMLKKHITELSGGEKQRVALIRNLIFTPKVLLLDEITTGLDAVTKDTVHHVMANFNKQGITIITVTHDESELAAADRLINIVGGRMEVTA